MERLIRKTDIFLPLAAVLLPVLVPAAGCSDSSSHQVQGQEQDNRRTELCPGKIRCPALLESESSLGLTFGISFGESWFVRKRLE